MHYPVLSEFLNVDIRQLARPAAKAHLAVTRSLIQDRISILAIAAKLDSSRLQDPAMWDTVTQFAKHHYHYRTLSQSEVTEKTEGLREKLGPLKSVVDPADLVAKFHDWGVEVSDISRQIGFDICCLQSAAICNEFPFLKWSLARTKHLDDCQFQQPSIVGFARRMEYLPFEGFSFVCGYVKAGSLFKQVEWWRTLAAEAFPK